MRLLRDECEYRCGRTQFVGAPFAERHTPRWWEGGCREVSGAVFAPARAVTPIRPIPCCAHSSTSARPTFATA